ncbi:hypothetical protein BJX62DRAFT_56922 [Aspergillus germanicus]
MTKGPINAKRPFQIAYCREGKQWPSRARFSLHFLPATCTLNAACSTRHREYSLTTYGRLPRRPRTTCLPFHDRFALRDRQRRIPSIAVWMKQKLRLVSPDRHIFFCLTFPPSPELTRGSWPTRGYPHNRSRNMQQIRRDGARSFSRCRKCSFP